MRRNRSEQAAIAETDAQRARFMSLVTMAFGAAFGAMLLIALSANLARAEQHDPWKSLNQAVYGANKAFYANVMTPLAQVYAQGVPGFVRGGVRNVFSNLREPMNMLSSALQGDMDNASNATARFAVNTTFGIAGAFDIATDMGLKSRREDLGQYFCSIGWTEGPYLELPIFGGGSFRDALGTVAGLGVTMLVIGPLTPFYWIADGTVDYFAAVNDGAYSVDPGTDDYEPVRRQRLDARAKDCQAARASVPEPKIRETRAA